MTKTSLEKNPDIPLDEFLYATVQRTKEYLEKDLNVNKINNAGKIKKAREPIIKDFTTLINVNGQVRGTFAMSIDEKLAVYLVRNFIFDEIPPDQLDEFVEDTMSEIFNTILGNMVSRLSESKKTLKIEAPTTIETRKANLKFVGLDIFASDINTEQGSLSINVVS